MDANRSNLRFGFYLLGILSIGSAIYEFQDIYPNFEFQNYLTIILLPISGIILLIFTKQYLDKKNIYSTIELDPIINSFTQAADKDEIKLFGGDLNFLGNNHTEIDNNSQYKVLKGARFRKILILCEVPGDNSTKIRYGKILHELRGVELKFYNPDDADLRIRGRMKKVQGVEKLMIYTKLESGKYQAIETDTANSNGALYNNIWKLVWSLAIVLSPQQQHDYEELYRKN